MKVLQVSDIHGSRRAAKAVAAKSKEFKPDAVLVVGDITNFGTVEEAENILVEIAGGFKAPILFVPGNCDPPQLLEYGPSSSNIVNIHAKKLPLQGYIFAGVGGSKTTPHRGTWIEFNEDQISEILLSFEVSGLSNLVLVSHTPPDGVEASKTASGIDLGSSSIRRFVEHHKPLIVCCGHVHEARSISRVGEVPVVNAGPAKDGYCAVIEISEGRARAKLDTL
ncbi:MAG: metallophosphoesterase family protein [Nitrososphaerota archaeon]|nr:metallophosphoesterase family protein [Candidatus Calditenuaceae archaeon]MDW8072928.1 metallophosphoesterase family protein [Nitrososphaerota archaeon]